VKALALISGGLDSILAARLIMDQGVDVVGVSFESPFFSAGGARSACAALGIELVVVDISEGILALLRGPKHGFGKHMNPCIDCHALMVHRTVEMMEDMGASFIVTGEVVGQRPKSQMRFGLQAVARESGAGDVLVRPLSAKLLSPTLPEERGWIDREKLLGLHGRTRKPQMELAERYGITEYATPAGGCLLADENFGRALKDLIEHDQLNVSEAALLNIGRQFRLSERAKLIVGRNHAENEELFRRRPPGDLCVKSTDRKGPVGVFAGERGDEEMKLAAGIVARYTGARAGETVPVQLWSDDGFSKNLDVEPLEPRSVREHAI